MIQKLGDILPFLTDRLKGLNAINFVTDIERDVSLTAAQNEIYKSGGKIALSVGNNSDKDENENLTAIFDTLKNQAPKADAIYVDRGSNYAHP